MDGVGHRRGRRRMRRGDAACCRSCSLLLAFPASASAAEVTASARQEVRPGPRPGVERLHYEFGPIRIKPGANTIEFAGNSLKPDVPGWIVGFKPDLVYKDGEVPRVDVIHLHHGVWLSNFAPLFAAGEEKTIVTAPEGYGWRYQPSDNWVMNHMIHNLKPGATDVYITYDLDFIPDDVARRRGDPGRAHGVARRHRHPGLSRVRRPAGARRQGRALHLSGRVGRAAGHELHEEHLDGRPGRRARRLRSAISIRAGCGRT